MTKTIHPLLSHYSSKNGGGEGTLRGEGGLLRGGGGRAKSRIYGILLNVPGCRTVPVRDEIKL